MGPGGTGKARPSAPGKLHTWGVAVGATITLGVLLNAAYFMRSSASVHSAVQRLDAQPDSLAALSRAGRAGAAPSGPAGCPPTANDSSAAAAAAAAAAAFAGLKASPIVSSEEEAKVVDYIHNYALKAPVLVSGRAPFASAWHDPCLHTGHWAWRCMRRPHRCKSAMPVPRLAGLCSHVEQRACAATASHP